MSRRDLHGEKREVKWREGVQKGKEVVKNVALTVEGNLDIFGKLFLLFLFVNVSPLDISAVSTWLIFYL